MKGEIVLAGACARDSTTRASSRNTAYYFTVSHPQCGVRELCAKTDNRRQQWIAKINDVASELDRSGGMFGKLLKQGGLKKNVWQERWCIVAGRTLDYFEAATDNQSKGAIDLLNATLREFTQKDKQCVEISAAVAGKKGMKKYVFAFDKDSDKSRWMEALKKASQPPSMDGTVNGSNPLLNNEALPRGSISQSFAELSSISLDKQMSGYLLKKSPNKMIGWQKRFFKMLPNGDIAYFKTEEESQKEGSSEARGTILLTELLPDKDVEVNGKTYEMLLRTRTKDYHLKASSLDEARSWADAIEAAVVAQSFISKA
eukprot:CAMPEP_0170074212 /NCGR_PEP_ID=MMETSP0019_2-20121128/11536_1 /TAXON_ID=98059 /ORGANISM="Dinobryon sp., Strain UTEXLB2267" /LENGTH=314 /DNA_ID=CAMNT_0010284329 /DNA_START=255 /DNA_END=1199 /DNA_ORIENTATION=+